MTSLGKRAAIGVFWAYLAFLGTKGINLAALVVLARLLGPETFGQMAICMIVIAYVEIIGRFGLGAALVSAQDDQARMEAAVALLSLVAAFGMVALLWVAAPVLAGAFGQTGLAWPLRVVALALVIDALAAVPMALLSKRLQFRRRAAPDFARSLVKAAVSLGLAASGFGLWSLVWGHVAGTLAATVTALAIAPWRPTASPTAPVIFKALRFGRHLFLADLITAAQRNLDALLVGRMLGPAALGLYTLASRWPDLVVRSFNPVAGSVLHPVMVSSGSDRQRLNDLYALSLRHVALFTFPAGTALAFAAEPIVTLLYTPAWQGMVAPMQYLSIALALLTVDHVPGILYKSMNRTDLLLWTSLLKLPVFVAVLFIAAPYGIETVALAQIGLSLAYLLPNGLILRRLLGIGFARTFAALIPATALSLALAATALILNPFLPAAPALHLMLLGSCLAAVFSSGLLLAVPALRPSLPIIFRSPQV